MMFENENNKKGQKQEKWQHDNGEMEERGKEGMFEIPGGNI